MERLIFTTCILIAISCSSRPDAIKIKTGKEGSILPSFKIEMDDTSKTFSTNNIKSGSPSFVMFFSPICPYCRMQTRRIKKNIDRLKSVQFILITETKYIPQLKAFKSEFEIDHLKNLVILIDTGHALLDYFKPIQYPYTAIYDSNKKLKYSYLGAMSDKSILGIGKL